MDASKNILNNKELNDIARDNKNKNLGIEFFESVRSDIISNIISQFGLSQFYDKFQDGSGVDTINNVRKNVFSSLEVEEKLSKESSGYDKSIQQKLHKGSVEYKNINSKLTKEQKNGQLRDVYTGKVLARNAKSDLDHIVSTKEAYEDKGRILSGVSIDELVNNKDNLVLVNRNTNRSMQDMPKSEYADKLADKKESWKQDRERIINSEHFSKDEKKKKINNIDNKLLSDEEKIRSEDHKARKAYNSSINKKYYTSNEFRTKLTKEAVKQAYSQAKKAAIGILSYELIDFIFEITLPVVKAWNTFPSMKSRINHISMTFKQSVSEFKSKIFDIVNKIWYGVIDSVVSGIVGQIINTLINTFKTTLGSFGKILNDEIIGIIRAIRVMTSNNSEITKEEKMKQGGIILSTTLSASIGVVISQSIEAILKETPLVNYSNEIGILVGAIFTGFMSAIMIFSINHMGEIIQKINNELSKIEGTKQNIKKKFNDVINSLDDAYRDILEKILSEYEKLNKLTNLAHDLDSFGKVQFENSIGLANAMGVGSDDMLQSKNDVNNFFTR